MSSRGRGVLLVALLAPLGALSGICRFGGESPGAACVHTGASQRHNQRAEPDDKARVIPRLASTPESGRPITQELSAGMLHRYPVMLEAGQFLHAEVEQQGIDVVVSLLDPAGSRRLEVDLPSGPQGPEPVYFVAETTGEHWIEVAPWPGSTSGTYEIRLAAAGDDLPDLAAGMDAYCRGYRLSRSPGSGGQPNLREAIGLFAAAARHWQTGGEQAAYLYASALIRIAQANRRLGEIRLAIEGFSEALEVIRHSGPRWHEANLLNALGVAYRRSGDTDSALACYEQAHAIAGGTENQSAEATALARMADLKGQLGQIYQALDLYDRATHIYSAIGESTGLATVLENRAGLLIVVDRLDEALDTLNRSVAIRIGMGDRFGQARIGAEIAWIHHRRGDSQKANDMLRDLVARWLDELPVSQRVGFLERLGTTYRSLGKREEALAAYDQALDELGRGELIADRGSILVNRAQLHLLDGEYELFLQNCAQGLALLEEADEKDAISHALFLMAKAQLALSRLEQARSSIERAIEIMEVVRDGTMLPSLSTAYSAARNGYYELLIEILMRLHEQQPAADYDARALEASERYRARTLAELLLRRSGQRAMPAVAQQERLELQLAINARESRSRSLAEAGAKPAEIAAPEGELRDLLLKLERVDLQARPDLAGGTPFAPHPIDLQLIRSGILDEQTQLLVYALAEERSFLWLVGPESLSTHALPGRDVIIRLAHRVHELMSRSHRRSARVQVDLVTSRLSEVLLGPVASQLVAPRLVVVADGALQAIPFAALLVPQVTGAEAPLAPRRLVELHQVVHLPSLSVLSIVRQRLQKREPAPRRLAVFADPVFSCDDPRIDCPPSEPAVNPADQPQTVLTALARSSADACLTGFHRLVFSGKESEAIISLLPADQRWSVSGMSATKAAVMSPELGRYRILHFATHGILHPRHPELSGLVLSLVDGTGQERDGFLRAHEIGNLYLAADLVVLSACKTAAGKGLRGEGVFSLTRSFMHAGVPRVIVSLWSVGDQSTAELMGRFYRLLLGDNLAPAEALRQAQVSMLEDERWASPYHWAGFVYQGEWHSR